MHESRRPCPYKFDTTTFFSSAVQQGDQYRKIVTEDNPDATPSKQGEDSRKMESSFYQYFELDSESDRPNPKYFEQIERCIDRNLRSVKLIDNETKKNEELRSALVIIYKIVFQTERQPEEDWIDKYIDTQDLKKTESNLIQEAFEHHKQDYAREFKIHIEPGECPVEEVVKEISLLLKSNPEFKRAVVAFKVICAPAGDLRSSGMPRIVIYPRSGQTIDEASNNAKNVLTKLENQLRDIEMRYADGKGIARDSYPITPMISVTQCSGDTKLILNRHPSIIDATKTLLDVNFDQTRNYAFLKGQSDTLAKKFD